MPARPFDTEIPYVQHIKMCLCTYTYNTQHTCIHARTGTHVHTQAYARVRAHVHIVVTYIVD